MELGIDRRAAAQRTALGDGSSWVELASRFVRDADSLFSDVVDRVAWQQSEVLRYDRYVPERRLVGSIHRDGPPDAVRHATLHLDAAHRVHFDGVAAILYRDGQDHQGLHSDREMRWLDHTLIAIVVLGARRPFVLRPRRPDARSVDRTPAGQADGDVVLHPGEGDLLVMGGRCQREWLHGVPTAPTTAPRISLTWRWTSRRGQPDTNPGYHDGRRFSDRRGGPGYRRSSRTQG